MRLGHTKTLERVTLESCRREEVLAYSTLPLVLRQVHVPPRVRVLTVVAGKRGISLTALPLHSSLVPPRVLEESHCSVPRESLVEGNRGTRLLYLVPCTATSPVPPSVCDLCVLALSHTPSLVCCSLGLRVCVFD